MAAKARGAAGGGALGVRSTGGRHPKPAPEVTKLAQEQFHEYVREGRIKGVMEFDHFRMLWEDFERHFGTEEIYKKDWGDCKEFFADLRDSASHPGRGVHLADFVAWYPTFLERIGPDKETIKHWWEERKAGSKKAAADAKAAVFATDGLWQIQLADLELAAAHARAQGKTPLFIDSTDGNAVEAFYKLSGAHIMEAKKWVLERAKGTPVEEVARAEQQRFFDAQCFKHGHTAVLRMANSAADIIGTWSRTNFPLLDLLDARAIKRVQGSENAAKFKDSPFLAMCPDDDAVSECTATGVHEKFHMVVITLFKEAEYEEYLKDALPMHLLQPIMPALRI